MCHDAYEDSATPVVPFMGVVPCSKRSHIRAQPGEGSARRRSQPCQPCCQTPCGRVWPMLGLRPAANRASRRHTGVPERFRTPGPGSFQFVPPVCACLCGLVPGHCRALRHLFWVRICRCPSVFQNEPHDVRHRRLHTEECINLRLGGLKPDHSCFAQHGLPGARGRVAGSVGAVGTRHSGASCPEAAGVPSKGRAKNRCAMQE